EYRGELDLNAHKMLLSVFRYYLLNQSIYCQKLGGSFLYILLPLLLGLVQWFFLLQIKKFPDHLLDQRELLSQQTVMFLNHKRFVSNGRTFAYAELTHLE